MQAKMIASRERAELLSYLEKNRDSLATTAGEVIGRCLEATGSREAWEAVNTNLLTEIRSDYIQSWPFMKSFMSLWNYRELEGVKIPFVSIRNLGPLEPPHGGVVEEVKINVPLDDSLFLPPDNKK